MAKRKQPSRGVERNIALCYVRLSQTRDERDLDSPIRQRDNIRRACEARGWIMEWYEDVEGHRSGTSEKGRPGWMALKRRLNDPDIAALVANDMSRLHRSGWRVGNLLEFIGNADVELVLAGGNRDQNFKDDKTRFAAQLMAHFDEEYARDIGRRAKDSIKFRKRQGVSVGIPPFGTQRDEEGYLEPSTEGAWLMPDGTFHKGKPDKPPHAEALWRSYYEAAGRVLNLYSEGTYGLISLAYEIQQEGWAYRKRNGQPTLFDGDDVRRIVANWAEYGGHVDDRRAKDRHPHETDLDTIQLIAERAVFPVELLYKVGQVRRARTLKRVRNNGIKRKDHPYPLAGITYCAHCEGLAEKHNDPTLRSRLGGWTANNGKSRRYRHKHGVKCGCTNKSVLCELYEADFERLLGLLSVNTEEAELLKALGVEAASALTNPTEARDLEAEKRAAIALCKRRIDAAITLYGDGHITKEEYRQRVEDNEREMAHWEARTTETERVAIELALCVDAVNRIADLWAESDTEDRRGMAGNLFSYLVYDLDTRRIVDFRLKPWADRFIVLRG
ncbi:MAG: recombinase family protein, partial [Chloroflexota bacterium]